MYLLCVIYNTSSKYTYTTPLYYNMHHVQIYNPPDTLLLYRYMCASRIYTRTVDLLFRKFAFCVYQARIAMPSDSDYVYCLMNGNKGITKVGIHNTHCTAHTSENKYHFRPYIQNNKAAFVCTTRTTKGLKNND